MSKLDAIFHKRLERIREELNSYIDSMFIGKEQKFSAPIPGRVPEERKEGGVQDKLLSPQEATTEERLTVQAPDYASIPSSAPAQTPSMAPGKSPVSRQYSMSRSGPAPRISADVTRIPDFLGRDEKHLDLDKVLAKKEESFSEMLLRMIDEKGLKDSEVYKNANIDRRLFSKMRGDEDYVPSKKTAISFCLALQLEMDEAKKLLATAGYTLSASSRFDLIIMYLIETKEYNVHFANIVLDDYGEGTLSR